MGRWWGTVGAEGPITAALITNKHGWLSWEEERCIGVLYGEMGEREGWPDGTRPREHNVSSGSCNYHHVRLSSPLFPPRLTCSAPTCLSVWFAPCSLVCTSCQLLWLFVFLFFTTITVFLFSCHFLFRFCLFLVLPLKCPTFVLHMWAFLLKANLTGNHCFFFK